MQYWLFKSEPDAFSIDDLRNMPRKTDHWDGVRNYQARNMMRDDMKKGDLAFFYHSSCPEPGIVGIVTITRESYVDYTAFEPKQKYYDAKSSEDNPRWFMVDVTFKKKFSQVLSLASLKANTKLKDMVLVQKGSRLSIMPVKKKEWDTIIKMADSA